MGLFLFMNHSIIAQTPRLQLRQMTEADAGNLFRLNQDEDVLRYTGDAPFADVEAAAAFLRAYDQYRLYGMGRWAVTRVADGCFLGWCGLKYTPAREEYDVGFRFLRQYWGQGYATEAAQASIELGFNQFHIQVIVGRAMAANSASLRVLEKAGLKLAGRLDFDGQPGWLYTIRNPFL